MPSCSIRDLHKKGRGLEASQYLCTMVSIEQPNTLTVAYRRYRDEEVIEAKLLYKKSTRYEATTC
jgi:hypothetical protein